MWLSCDKIMWLSCDQVMWSNHVMSCDEKSHVTQEGKRKEKGRHKRKWKSYSCDNGTGWKCWGCYRKCWGSGMSLYASSAMLWWLHFLDFKHHIYLWGCCKGHCLHPSFSRHFLEWSQLAGDVHFVLQLLGFMQLPQVFITHCICCLRALGHCCYHQGCCVLWVWSSGLCMLANVSRYSGEACCPGYCLWYCLNCSWRFSPLIWQGILAPEGRVSLPNTFHLHFLARMYSSTSAHSSSKCMWLLQNLQCSSKVCLASGSGMHWTKALTLARYASRPFWSAATVSASTLRVALITSDFPGSGLLRNVWTGNGSVELAWAKLKLRLMAEKHHAVQLCKAWTDSVQGYAKQTQQ